MNRHKFSPVATGTVTATLRLSLCIAGWFLLSSSGGAFAESPEKIAAQLIEWIPARRGLWMLGND